MRRLALSGALAALVATLGTPSEATQTKGTCASHYESAQALRRSGNLVLAREILGLCEGACPKRLAADCQRWGAELDAEIPTVVFEARESEGRALEGVRVTIDGKQPPLRVPSDVVRLNPGNHTLSFTAPDGKTLEQVLVVDPGERSRRVVAVFESPKPPPLPPAPPPPPAPCAERSQLLPAASYVLFTAGLVGLGVGAALAIDGHLDVAALEDGCGATGQCSEEQVAPIRRTWAIAGVATAVGGAAVASAVIVGLVAGARSREEALRATPWLRFGGPAPAGVTIGARF
jgi:hypothetical protein